MVDMEKWNIPFLKIGDLELKLLQGAMGVGVSWHNLVTAIINQGGGGTIASVGLNEVMGIGTGDYKRDSSQALAKAIRLVRSETIGAKGALGVNIMGALSNYHQLVQTSIDENVDFIISGAGIPRDLPAVLRLDSKTKIIPIISSGRLAEMICKSWLRQKHLPDAIVVEGPKAGGHLGYSPEQLTDSYFVEHGLEKIISEVIEIVKPFEEQAQRKIPIIAAGGIFYGGDIKKFLNLGASGVQMATRFVTTPECDADIRFKQAYIYCNPWDLKIIDSPVGMPGRVIETQFVTDAANQKFPIKCGYQCLISCDQTKTHYCIADALVDARKGERTIIFAGSNAWRCNEILSVQQVFENLNTEYVDNKTSD